MNDIAENWFKSGKAAVVMGLKLRPIENPWLKGTPMVSVRGQARALYLTDDNNNDWILKKFSPAKIPDSTYIKGIQALIPHWPGLHSGYLRRVVSKSDISRAGFFNTNFAEWLENTVLMPRIKCDDWATLADKIRSGLVKLTRDERLLVSNRLSKQISLLEANHLSHRDLSVTNVFVDLKAQLVHIIDWDCLFHPSLTMPPNTPFGTEGYVAPFVARSGTPDAGATWRTHADRFSMAILNAEFLSMDQGTPLKNDGGMFEQSELFNRGGPETTRALSQLQKNFPNACVLLERALQAQDFDDCPSPGEWLAVSTPVTQTSPKTASPAVSSSSPQSNVTSKVVPQTNSTPFVLLDEAALVKLDTGAFVPPL